MTEMGNMGSMNMEATMGFLGENLLVNGQTHATLTVATCAYRLRLLNGSNSRIYKLAWSDDRPLTVIATDGGLLEKPLQRNYITLAPGERVELWADFSPYKPGDEIKLRSLEYTGVEAGMIMGDLLMPMESSSPLPSGAAFDLLTVRIERQEAETLTLPAQLAPLERYQMSDVVNATAPRLFELAMLNGQWLINGQQFEMEAVDPSEIVPFDMLEVWEFRNEQGVGAVENMSSGGMSGMHHSHQGASTANLGLQNPMTDFMAHPMHIHGVQFQVVERQIDPTYAAGWETVNAGFVDEGWKDTVLVMPGERVKVLIRFDQYPGRYLVHCHNLEHETMGMMRNFLVQ
jgi:FtsP/CotA-like multicopper oxidase with cupredoxin domain